MGTKAHVKWVYTERLWLHTTTQLPCAHRRPIRPVKLRSRPTPNHRPPESDMPITNDGRDLIRINLSLTFYWPGRRAVHKHACKQKKRKISTANQNNREKKHNQKNINGIIWFFFSTLCWFRAVVAGIVVSHVGWLCVRKLNQSWIIKKMYVKVFKSVVRERILFFVDLFCYFSVFFVLLWFMATTFFWIEFFASSVCRELARVSDATTLRIQKKT